jgi:hypothetical protein
MDIFVDNFKCANSPSPSVFERHSLNVMEDILYAAKLENDFTENDENSSSKMKSVFRNAFTNVRQMKNSSLGSGRNISLSSTREAEQMSQSLQELVASIGLDAESGILIYIRLS